MRFTDALPSFEVRSSRTPHRRGLSLVEMLVVIALIAILVSLLVPALGAARTSAWASRGMANTRTLTQVIHAYADANRDLLPALEKGVSYPGISPIERFRMPYWEVAFRWTGVTYDILPYYDNIRLFISPGSPRTRNLMDCWPTSYHYSQSFVADPRLWTPGATADESLQRRCRLSDTLFPSRKAMLWDDEAAFRRPVRRTDDGDLLVTTNVASADVSVVARIPANASRPVTNPFPVPLRTKRLHNTFMGQRGTDY